MKRTGKKIRRAEERAEKVVKSTVARKAAGQAISSRLCGPLRLVPLDLLVLLRLLILLLVAINGCPFLGVHPKLPGPVTVLRVVSLVTGDLNAFRVRVD